MNFQTGMGAKLGIRGTLECRNAAGEVIKTIEMNGAFPLEDLGLSVEEAQQLIDQQKGADHGTHDRE